MTVPHFSNALGNYTRDPMPKMLPSSVRSGSPTLAILLLSLFRTRHAPELVAAA